MLTELRWPLAAAVGGLRFQVHVHFGLIRFASRLVRLPDHVQVRVQARRTDGPPDCIIFGEFARHTRYAYRNMFNPILNLVRLVLLLVRVLCLVRDPHFRLHHFGKL